MSAPTIRLIDVAANYKQIDHQKKAIAFLQQHLDPETLRLFALLYRGEATLGVVERKGDVVICHPPRI